MLFQILKMSQQSCLLLQLPIEIFGHICYFLPAPAVCQLEATSMAVKESLEEAGVWRRMAEQLGKGTNYSFVLSMLGHVKVNKFKDSSVYKVIVGTTMIIKELVLEVEKGFSN